MPPLDLGSLEFVYVRLTSNFDNGDSDSMDYRYSNIPSTPKEIIEHSLVHTDPLTDALLVDGTNQVDCGYDVVHGTVYDTRTVDGEHIFDAVCYQSTSAQPLGSHNTLSDPFNTWAECDADTTDSIEREEFPGGQKMGRTLSEGDIVKVGGSEALCTNDYNAAYESFIVCGTLQGNVGGKQWEQGQTMTANGETYVCVKDANGGGEWVRDPGQTFGATASLDGEAWGGKVIFDISQVSDFSNFQATGQYIVPKDFPSYGLSGPGLYVRYRPEFNGFQSGPEGATFTGIDLIGDCVDQVADPNIAGPCMSPYFI